MASVTLGVNRQETQKRSHNRWPASFKVSKRPQKTPSDLHAATAFLDAQASAHLSMLCECGQDLYTSKRRKTDSDTQIRNGHFRDQSSMAMSDLDCRRKSSKSKSHSGISGSCQRRISNSSTISMQDLTTRNAPVVKPTAPLPDSSSYVLDMFRTTGGERDFLLEMISGNSISYLQENLHADEVSEEVVSTPSSTTTTFSSLFSNDDRLTDVSSQSSVVPSPKPMDDDSGLQEDMMVFQFLNM